MARRTALRLTVVLVGTVALLSAEVSGLVLFGMLVAGTAALSGRV